MGDVVFVADLLQFKPDPCWCKNGQWAVRVHNGAESFSKSHYNSNLGESTGCYLSEQLNVLPIKPKCYHIFFLLFPCIVHVKTSDFISLKENLYNQIIAVTYKERPTMKNSFSRATLFRAFVICYGFGTYSVHVVYKKLFRTNQKYKTIPCKCNGKWYVLSTEFYIECFDIFWLNWRALLKLFTCIENVGK